MDATQGPTFGELLRRYRLAAGLTQEELAERAQVSQRAISDLERGQRTRPWRDTVQLLATALGLGAADRAQLEVAGRRATYLAPETIGPRPRDDSSPPRHNLPVPLTSFVGREREIAAVRQHLAQLMAGYGQVLVVAGEPGAGKTRLGRELAALAESLGAAVYRGSCRNWDGTPAFWPWAEVLRGYCEKHEPTVVASVVGASAPLIYQLLPELRAQLPTPPEAAHLDPAQARFLVLDGIRRLLREAARQQPTIVILEDLHWADPGSLQLLSFIASDIVDERLLVVATYRDTEIPRDHPLNRTLAELAILNPVRTLALGGLTREDVGRFIEQHTGQPSSLAARQALWSATGGNPFFVGEFLLLLQGEGRLDTLEGEVIHHLAVPPGVRQTIRRRLDQMSEKCRDLLKVAAVIGREFGLTLLARAVGAPLDELLGTLDLAIAARLVRETDQVGSFQFDHDVIQETLYGDLGVAQRMRLHARVGTAQEELRAADLRPVLTELARHFVAAAPLGMAPRAIDYSVRAAEQAASQTAWETAIGHYERALQVMDQLGSANEIGRCDILLALGSMHQANGLPYGNSSAMREACRRAAEVARKVGSPERFARAVLGFAGPNPLQTFGGAEQIRLGEEALAILDRADSPLRATLLARLAADARLAPDAIRPSVLSEEAVAMARRVANPSALTFALLYRHAVQWTPDDASRRLADAEEIFGRLVLPRDLHTMFLASMFKTADLLELGDVRNARAAFDPYLGALVEFGLPSTTHVGIAGMWALAEGRLARAEELLVPHIEALGRPATALRVLFGLRSEQGRLPEMEPIIEEALRLGTGTTVGARAYPIYRMLLHAATGREAIARAELEVIARQGFADIPRDTFWFSSIALLVEACVALGDVDRARLLYDLLSPYEACFLAYVPFYVCHGSGAYFLGLLATVRGDYASAEQHLYRAVAAHQRAGMPPLVAYAHCALADALIRQQAERERGRVVPLLDQANATAAALGMPRLEAKIAEVRRTIDGR
jgi:transcriptional regulator with XRE-family HTH domain